jgi:hypothetical protein
MCWQMMATQKAYSPSLSSIYNQCRAHAALAFAVKNVHYRWAGQMHTDMLKKEAIFHVHACVTQTD